MPITPKMSSRLIDLSARSPDEYALMLGKMNRLLGRLHVLLAPILRRKLDEHTDAQYVEIDGLINDVQHVLGVSCQLRELNEVMWQFLSEAQVAVVKELIEATVKHEEELQEGVEWMEKVLERKAEREKVEKVGVQKGE